MDRLRASRKLSAEELRRFVVEQRAANRQARLDHFRKTGRIDPAAAAISGETDIVADEYVFSPGLVRARPRRRFLDAVLLLVEIGAVVGLVFVIFNGLNMLKDLNRQVLGVIQQPTLTPTPLIMVVVLPAGHLPPDAQGSVRPNEAEIPQHLRPLVQSMADVPVPTPSIEQAARIQIPAIDVDAPVVQGDGWEQLKKGVAQHIGSANPGQRGNVVLSGHNDVFGEIFRDLDRLKSGDEVILFTSQRTYTYVVTSNRITEPTDIDVMKPTIDPVVTLISCYPYRVDNQRIVVNAVLKIEK
ncbi:MAG: class D sortase [Chloroflexota bacterium]|jgi:sortase A